MSQVIEDFRKEILKTVDFDKIKELYPDYIGFQHWMYRCSLAIPMDKFKLDFIIEVVKERIYQNE